MRPSSRQRRHLNGSSNASQERPASGASLRPMPASRAAEQAAGASDSSGEPALLSTLSSNQDGTARLERRSSGSVTARRPQTAHLLDEQAVQAARRRVHSARAETPDRVAGRQQAGEAVNSSEGLLIRQGGGQREQPGSETAASRGSFVAGQRSGSDAVPVVQWAVAAGSNRPRQSTPGAKQTDTDASRPASQPTAFEEFGALLRDRYEGKRSLRAAFLNWDSGKDGRMSSRDVQKLIVTLGFDDRLGSAKVEAVLQHVDALPNACLRYKDFCRLISKSSDRETSGEEKVAVTRSSVPRGVSSETHQAHQALYPDIGSVVELLRRKYQTRKLRTAFRDWDGDKDGCITEAELDSNLRRQGVQLSPPLLHQLFGVYDKDADGKMEYHEFIDMINGPIRGRDSNPVVQARVRAAAERQDEVGASGAYPVLRKVELGTARAGLVESDEFQDTVMTKLRAFAPRLNDAYAAFDGDHSGNLSYMEFRQGLQQVGLHLTEREFFHLATAVDTDGSGEISFKEFCQMFTKGKQGGVESVSWPKPASDGSRDHGAAGSFDFSHLVRRAKIPTRCGRTPYNDTSGVLRHSVVESSEEAASRFSTEARMYGSNESRSRGPNPRMATTLGQEDKQRRDAAHVSRLQRIRQQLNEYNSLTQQTHASDNEAQDRRVRTIQRQVQRYQEAIDQQHPQYARTEGKAVQTARADARSTPWG